jgi:hypothetical protein
MKRIVIASFFTVLMTSAFAQTQNNLDPSYSARNYKHANKAAMASRSNLDKAIALKPVLVQGGPEYKHRFNQTFVVVKGSANTGKPAAYRKGYKHSFGL